MNQLALMNGVGDASKDMSKIKERTYDDGGNEDDSMDFGEHFPHNNNNKQSSSNGGGRAGMHSKQTSKSSARDFNQKQMAMVSPFKKQK